MLEKIEGGANPPPPFRCWKPAYVYKLHKAVKKLQTVIEYGRLLWTSATSTKKSAAPEQLLIPYNADQMQNSEGSIDLVEMD